MSGRRLSSIPAAPIACSACASTASADWPGPQISSVASSSGPTFAAYVLDKSEEKTFNQEIRLVSKLDSRWNWIAGAYYNHFDLHSSSAEHTPGIPEWYGFPTGTSDLEYLAVGDQTYDESALFGELGFRLTDAWQVTVGTRYFRFKVDSHLTTTLPFVDFATDDRASTDDDNTIFKFNTSYRINDDLMTYLTVSEGYRAGGINVGSVCQNPLPPGQNVCLTPDEVLIKPDTTTNYEVGLRSTWLDGALLFNVALYYIDWNDVQVLGNSKNGGIPITVNGSSAESKGIELTTTWNITDQIQVAASYSYNDAKLSADAPGLVDGVDALKGDRLAGSPQQQGTLLFGWTRPLTGGYTLSADYSMTAVSDVYTKVGLQNSGEALPGYAIHGLSLGLSSGPWSAHLYAVNLFNKYAITSVRRDRSYIYLIERDSLDPIPSRTYFQSPLRPRTIGLEFNYRFDL